MAIARSVGQKLLLLFVPPLYLVLSNILFFTCRVKEYGKSNFETCHLQPAFIAAVWHYSIFLAINSMRGRDWVAMVSASKDAELIARLLKLIGFATVRGSRGKGGLRAIKEMVSFVVDKEYNAAIIADGSQGPPRRVQAGAILLASKTGAPILPTAWGVERYKAFRSWDRTVLPMPFTRIAVYYGEPLYVPGKLKAAQLEEYRLELENRLNQTYQQAWNIFGKKIHDCVES